MTKIKSITICSSASFYRQAWLMKKHFDEVRKAQAILVVNLMKKGLNGYIGGNLLMEMGLAFYLKKPIFIWNPVPKSAPFYEEIMGMFPVFINRNLSKIK